jgi:hypothetical protein
MKLSREGFNLELGSHFNICLKTGEAKTTLTQRFLWTLKPEGKKEDEGGGEEALHLEGDKRFSYFEGSQAVPASPSGRGMFERG